MDKLKYIKLKNEDGTYTNSIPLAVDSDYVDVDGISLTSALNAKANSTSVNSSIAALTNEINTQKSRIDNLAHLEDGSTTGDAELQDIRIGFNSKTHLSAGDAVREQIEYLNNMILSGDNIVTKDTLNITIIENSYINTSGEIHELNDYSVVQNVPVIPSITAKLDLKSLPLAGWRALVFYDENHNFISSVRYQTNTTIYEIVVPKNAVTCSFTIYSDTFEFFKIANLSDEIVKIYNNLYNLNVLTNYDIPYTFTDNQYIDSDGKVTSHDNYKLTNYIPIGAFKKIKFLQAYLASAKAVLFDEFGNITRVIENNYGNTNEDIEIIINDNEKYIRISCINDRVNEFFINSTQFNIPYEMITKVHSIPNDYFDIVLNPIYLRSLLIYNIPYTFTDNQYIDFEGKVTSHDNYKLTNYIFIGAFKKIKFLQAYLSSARAVLFNEKGGVTRVIENNHGNTNEDIEITINDNEKYIRISCINNRVDRFFINSTQFNIPYEMITKAHGIPNDYFDTQSSDDLIHDGRMMKIFRTIGVVGDSLASGEMSYTNHQNKTSYVDMYDYSWIQYIARTCGSTGFNFSVGGMDTRAFLQDDRGMLTKMLNPDNKCQAYFIALGHNDHNHDIPLGSVSDIDLSDYTNNADTYYGNYGGIIQRIQEICPSAKIFVVTMKVAYGESEGWNTAIRNMANIFDNVYVVDMHEKFPSIPSWHYTQGHGNAMGYEVYSEEITTCVNDIIQNNRNDFKYVQFINTEYEYAIPTVN